MESTHIDPAVETFAALAPHYERFTKTFKHERWMRSLADLARRHGLVGIRALDVACGTGKSLAPLLDQGFEVVGCDISEEMLAVARDRHPQVTFHQADMRALPDLGRFAWVTCMNDAMNFMLGDDDLRLTLAGMRGVLVPGGLIAFDVNSASGHRRSFGATWARDDGDAYICWHGRGCHDRSAVVGVSDVVLFNLGCNGWERTDSRHIERLWTDDDIRAAAADAGLELIARYGQRPGCIIEPEVDEGRHHKVVYFLRRPALDHVEGVMHVRESIYP